MRKGNLLLLIGIVVMAILIGFGAYISAQDQQKPVQKQSSVLIMFGGLKLKENADKASAEKLFNEYLIPSMKDKKGLKMKVLKKMSIPNEMPNSYDYVMVAEVEDPMIIMQLMSSQGRDSRLEQFGRAMKEYAGEPNLALYTVIADTREAENK